MASKDRSTFQSSVDSDLTDGGGNTAADVRGLFDDLSDSTLSLKDEIHSVTAYGAVGDGTTDDTSAIQDAISAAWSARHPVFFPAGTYLVGDINLPDSGSISEGILFYGAGQTGTTLQALSGATNIIFKGTGNRTAHVVRDMKLDGDGNVSFPIRHKAGRGSVYENLTIENFTSGGIHLGDNTSTYTVATRCVIRNCTIQDFASTSYSSRPFHGIVFGDTSTTDGWGAFDNLVEACTIRYIRDNGIRDVAGHNRFSHNHIYGGTTNAIFSEQKCIAVANYIDTCPQSVYLRGQDNVFVGNIVYVNRSGSEFDSGATYQGVRVLSGAERSTVVGNTFENVDVDVGGTGNPDTYWGNTPSDESGAASTENRVPGDVFIGSGSTRTEITSGGVRPPRHTDSSRPSAGDAGRIIFNTDDGQLNIDDGTNWTLPDGTTT